MYNILYIDSVQNQRSHCQSGESEPLGSRPMSDSFKLAILRDLAYVGPYLLYITEYDISVMY